MNFKIIEYESLLQNFALKFVFKQSFKLERRNNSGIEGRIGSIFAVHFLPSRRRDIGHDIRACLGPLEAILASNYTVKVTKGTVKGRGMFAGVDARSMQERVAKGTIRKERRRAEKERGREGRKEEGGAPRNAAQLLIRLRAQSASSRARGRRGPPDFAKRSLDNFLPPFFPPPLLPLEQTRGDTRRPVRIESLRMACDRVCNSI